MKLFYIKLLTIISISCLGIIVYSNTFLCPFYFDDVTSIVDNYFIRNIQNLKNIWIYCPHRFVLYLSIALNYRFDQLHVFGYHLFNLAVHLGAAILVWWLTLLTFSTPAMKDEKIARHRNAISLFAGLIFVTHPVQTEAVTYIVQRLASTATLFYLASLSLYVKSRLLQNKKSTQERLYYICSLVMAIMAMFTKEIAITLPLMIVLYEFSFLKGKGSLHWKPIVPFLLTLLIIPVTVLLAESLKAQGFLPEGPYWISSTHYLLTQFRVVVTYIRLAFLPFNQNLDYDYPISSNIFELPTLLSFLFLITILFSAQRLFSKYRLVSFSIFWFFLALLPESSLFPIKDVIFEHRLYLPLVGYSMFLVSGAYYLFYKKTLGRMAVILTMIMICNSVLTYQRNKVWTDGLVLWNDTVGKSPHKARPHLNRGMIYSKQGDLARALFDYNKAIEINPNYAEVYNNRGNVYLAQGDLAQALFDCNKAVEINPNYAEAYNNRGNVYLKQGDLAQALFDYNKAIEINPNYTEAYNNRGNVYFTQGDLAQALLDYNKAIEINPTFAEAYSSHGNVYLKQGDLAQALLDYNKAIEINPTLAEAYVNRGVAYVKEGNIPQTMSDFTKAIEINPNYAKAYSNRGIVYYMKKEYDKAWTDVHKSESLGHKVSLEFIEKLKKASGRDK